MTGKTKCLTLISMVLLFFTLMLIADGTLYRICAHVGDKVGYDTKCLFLLTGIVLYVLTITISIYTGLCIRKELVPPIKHRQSPSIIGTQQYSAYEEAKSHCRMLCMQCGENCCPLVRNNTDKDV